MEARCHNRFLAIVVDWSACNSSCAIRAGLMMPRSRTMLVNVCESAWSLPKSLVSKESEEVAMKVKGCEEANTCKLLGFNLGCCWQAVNHQKEILNRRSYNNICRRHNISRCQLWSSSRTLLLLKPFLLSKTYVASAAFCAAAIKTCRA